MLNMSLKYIVAASLVVGLGACGDLGASGDVTSPDEATVGAGPQQGGAGGTQANQGNVACTDGQIAAIYAALNSSEIQAGALAEQTAKNKKVVGFAKRMVANHTQALTTMGSLLSRANISPVQTDTSVVLQKLADANLQVLSSMAKSAGGAGPSAGMPSGLEKNPAYGMEKNPAYGMEKNPAYGTEINPAAYGPQTTPGGTEQKPAYGAEGKAPSGTAPGTTGEKTATDFERVFIADQVLAHAAVLGMLDNLLIPGAQNKELKTQLQKDRGTVARHLALAQQVQSSIVGVCGSATCDLGAAQTAPTPSGAPTPSPKPGGMPSPMAPPPTQGITR